MVIDSLHGKYGLQHPRSPHGMTVIAFETIDGYGCKTGTLDGNRLHLVIEHGSSAMSIDEGKILLLMSTDGGTKGQTGSLTILCRCTDMVGIVSDGPRCDAPRFTLLWLCTKYQCGRCFTQIQTETLHIERSARLGG